MVTSLERTVQTLLQGTGQSPGEFMHLYPFKDLLFLSLLNSLRQALDFFATIAASVPITHGLLH